MSQADSDELSRRARRWADVAWAQGWHAHAIDVLDRALELKPDCFKLYRKRGAFYLLCPDATIRDDEQAYADLRRACELSDWRDDLARWVIELLTRNGDVVQAKEMKRELAKRHPGPMVDES
jgi:hypothetical protein